MLGPLAKAQLVAFLTKKVRSPSSLPRPLEPVRASSADHARRAVGLSIVGLMMRQLVESPTFVRSVESLHGSVSALQQSAYDALERATAGQSVLHLGIGRGAPARIALIRRRGVAQRAQSR